MDWLELIDLIANGNGQNFTIRTWLEQQGQYGTVLEGWWPLQGRNPSQDIEVRPCTIQDDPGLLFIEARVPDSSGKTLEVNASHNSLMNHIQIHHAITQAAASLHLTTNIPGGVSRDHYYQLSKPDCLGLALGKSR